MKTLPRRHFLHGLGGVGLGLPLMSSMGCSKRALVEELGRSRQGADGFPIRLLCVYTPNGNFDMPDAALSGMWAPLADLKSKINVIRGLDLSVHDKPPGEPHQQGMAVLTGRSLNTGAFVGGDGTLAGWASGISVDQQIANAVGTMTQHKSLHAGVQSTAYGGTEVRTIISYAGADDPIENETSPYNLFDTVFSQLGADPVGIEKLRARRKSVLDTVGKQYDAISKKVGKEDRAKLEAHLQKVREVESRLDNPGGVIGGFCQKPERGGVVDLNDPNNYPAIGKLHMDLITMAFACDLTRVATLQWSASTNNKPFPYLQYNGQPITGDDHVMAHQPDTDEASWGPVRVIREWYIQQMRYLLGALDAIPEGSGTMLDNTLVIFFSEIARGNTHSHTDCPFIVAGGAGGAIKTGQFLDYQGTVFHNNLLLSAMNAYGIEDTTFGDPAYCTGHLSELFV
jgi:hypothetical protein